MDQVSQKYLVQKTQMVEKTELWIVCEKPLEGDGRAIRGFFGNLYRNRPEFHNHLGQRLIYRHPLIQYKIFGGSALVIGLKEGAYLLKAVPEIEYLELHHLKNAVVKRTMIDSVVPIGLTSAGSRYKFTTPWIGLNEKNYQAYVTLKDRQRETTELCDKIIVGNILSMCKSLGYTVDHPLYVESDLRESTMVAIKDVNLVSFAGEFEANFLIPEFWGIGGKVSLGYGTVKPLNGGKI